MRGGPQVYPTVKQLLPALGALAMTDEGAKWASFALGNALHHTDELYSTMGSTLPCLLPCTASALPRVRSNAAGAVANGMRHGAALVPGMARAGLLEAIASMALSDEDADVRAVAWFALYRLSTVDAATLVSLPLAGALASKAGDSGHQGAVKRVIGAGPE